MNRSKTKYLTMPTPGACASPTPGRLDQYDREEIRAAARAGVAIEQLAQEYKRLPVTIRRILAKCD